MVVTNTNTSQITQYFYDADGTRVRRNSLQGTTAHVNTDYEVTGPSQMVMPPLPPTYTHKLNLAIVTCANCNGIPPVSALPMNLASARVTYRFNSQWVAIREGITLKKDNGLSDLGWTACKIARGNGGVYYSRGTELRYIYQSVNSLSPLRP